MSHSAASSEILHKIIFFTQATAVCLKLILKISKILSSPWQSSSPIWYSSPVDPWLQLFSSRLPHTWSSWSCFTCSEWMKHLEPELYSPEFFALFSGTPNWCRLGTLMCCLGYVEVDSKSYPSYLAVLLKSASNYLANRLNPRTAGNSCWEHCLMRILPYGFLKATSFC